MIEGNVRTWFCMGLRTNVRTKSIAAHTMKHAKTGRVVASGRGAVTLVPMNPTTMRRCRSAEDKKTTTAAWLSFLLASSLCKMPWVRLFYMEHKDPARTHIHTPHTTAGMKYTHTDAHTHAQYTAEEAGPEEHAICVVKILPMRGVP